MTMVSYCLPGVFQKLAFFLRSFHASVSNLEKPAFDNFPYLLTRQKHTKWHIGSTKFALPTTKSEDLILIQVQSPSQLKPK